MMTKGPLHCITKPYKYRHVRTDIKTTSKYIRDYCTSMTSDKTSAVVKFYSI